MICIPLLPAQIIYYIWALLSSKEVWQDLMVPFGKMLFKMLFDQQNWIQII